MNIFRRVLRHLVPGLVVLGVGCATPTHRDSARQQPPRPLGHEFHTRAVLQKPVVSVSGFEDRSGFSGSWKLQELSGEFAQRLVESGRVIVVEQHGAGGMITTLARQARGLLRSDEPTKAAQISERYQIRGVITDFSVYPDASGWFPQGPAPKRSATTARVAIRLTILDLESGQIIATPRGEGSVTIRSERSQISYPSIPFKSDTFYRTLLGQAADQALTQALRGVLSALPTEYWVPRVAEGGVDSVVINGGANVGVRIGMEYLVRPEGRRLTDPETGRDIDVRLGPVTGRVRVIEVRPQTAVAGVVEGEAARGDYLVPPGR